MRPTSPRRVAEARPSAEILGFPERELLELKDASSPLVEEDRAGMLERSLGAQRRELNRASHIVAVALDVTP